MRICSFAMKHMQGSKGKVASRIGEPYNEECIEKVAEVAGREGG